MSNFNTLSNEQNLVQFFNNNATLQGLQQGRAKGLIQDIKGEQKATFDRIMQLADIIGKGIVWYNSAEGKVQREVAGIEWNVADMGREVYGLGKTQLYNYNKAYKAMQDNDRILKDYKEFVSNEQKAGEDVELTLKGFLAYVKEENAPVEDEDKSVVEASFKFGSIGAKFYDDGRVELGKNSLIDVENALEYMLQQVREKSEKEAGLDRLVELGLAQDSSKLSQVAQDIYNEELEEINNPLDLIGATTERG